MTSVSYHFELPTRIMLATDHVATVIQRAMTDRPASPPEGTDPQERRWQLEWDRRNVED